MLSGARREAGGALAAISNHTAPSGGGDGNAAQALLARADRAAAMFAWAEAWGAALPPADAVLLEDLRHAAAALAAGGAAAAGRLSAGAAAQAAAVPGRATDEGTEIANGQV